VSRKTISGALDLAGYEKLAPQHRPTDSRQLAAEARKLYGAGHSAAYMSRVLQLPLDEVVKAIEERPE